MSNKDWTEKLRDRLESHQVAAPDDLWAGIEARLDAARQPSMGEGRDSRKRRAVLVPLRRWGVAAAIAALGIVGWQLTGSGGGEEELAYPSPQQEAPSSLQQEAYPSPIPSGARPPVAFPKGKDVELPIEATSRGGDVDNAKTSSNLLSYVGKKEAEMNASPSINQQEDVEIPAENTNPSANQGVDVDKPVEATNRSINQKVDVGIHTEADVSRNSSNQTSLPWGKATGRRTEFGNGLGRASRSLSLTLYASNGLADSRNANGVMMAESMANNYMAAAASMKRSSPTPVIYMAGYEEREQHRQPFSVGLSVGIPIHERFTLTTGLAYTQLHADFLKIMNKRQLAKEQDLQYVGCPVNLNYRFLETKLLKAYVAAGGQIDLNVKAKSVTEGVETEMPKDRAQFSTQAAVGLQLDVLPQVGMYVEPGVKYYFDNGSNVRTFFKDKPCNFNLQVGLRWNFEQ